MKKNRRSRSESEMSKNFKLLIALLATFGLLGAVFIYSTNLQTRVSSQSQIVSPPAVQQSSEKDQKTINCAKKIDQDGDKSLLSQKPGDTNCLYLGCGGFFQ